MRASWPELISGIMECEKCGLCRNRRNPVLGEGDPNAEDGAYKQAIGLLYGIAFTIKMSRKGDHQIEGYFDYVVPPLEGFWWQEGVEGVDYAHKENFHWISVIRLPDFVTREDFSDDKE